MKVKFFLTIILVFLLDRITKILAVKLFSSPVVVVPNFFTLRLAENRGAAFSIFSQGNEIVRFFFLILLPILVVGGIFYYLFFSGKERSSLEAVSFGLIVGGALGNLFDRVFYGKVVDFLDFHFYSYHYPTFNVADVAVFVGCLILLFRHLRP